MIRAPARTKARALVTKVKDGTITVSPGCRSSNKADISRALVQDVVKRTSAEPRVPCRSEDTLLEKGPLADICPDSRLWSRYSCSRPMDEVRLNGIEVFSTIMNPRSGAWAPLGVVSILLVDCHDVGDPIS